MSVNQPSEFVKPQAHTKDAFLGGKLSVWQAEAGFRAGLDSVLLGTSVPEGAGRLLDLGAGAGVASLCALAHDARIEATLVEIDPATSALAKRNLAENGFEDRAAVLNLDVTAPGGVRKSAGLPTDNFDIVIANPPYFASGTPARDAARAEARHMDGTLLEMWVKTAVSSAHAQATIMFIHRVEALPELLAAFADRMGAITVLPLCSRPGMAASRVLIRGKKGSRAPLTLLPSIALHGAEGHGFTSDIDDVFRGTTRFDWHTGNQVPISKVADP